LGIHAIPEDRGVDLISDALPFVRLWYGEPNAISNAKLYNRSHDAVIRVYEEPGNELDEADLYWGRIAIQDWQ
jgi:hypothetical protein